MHDQPDMLTMMRSMYGNLGRRSQAPRSPAELGARAGVEAIYRAIAWDSGTWAIEQIDESELPEPNVHQSNEAILMEGCRLLDESRRQPLPQEP
jgi:hypothetical protein